MMQRHKLIFSQDHDVKLAINDLILGFLSYRIWSMLAWQEIKTRYRRSVIGPFWLTLSTAIMIGSIGPLYAALFSQPLDKYFSFVTVNLIVWQFISATIQGASQAFIASEGYIKQIKLPLSLYVIKLVWINLIIFFHNMIVVVIVFYFFPPEFNFNALIFLLGLFMAAVNAVWVGLVLALLCARFRDVSQIVASGIAVMFFLTPIMWLPKMLGKHEWVVELNPLFHFMEIIRGPLLGSPFRLFSWVAVLGITLLGYIFMIFLFSRYRARVAYWL